MPETEQQPNEQPQPSENETQPTPKQPEHGAPPLPEKQQPPAEPEKPNDEQPNPDVFPREYVEKLRTENADYRNRAKTADDLAKRLHTELVRATGKLADPTDMPFDTEHLDDPEKLAAAIEALVEAKPHLRARRVVGAVGQGESGGSGTFSLLDAMRSGA